MTVDATANPHPSAIQTLSTPAPLPRPTGVPKHNNFDCLRLFLAALVVVSHSWALGLGSEEGEPFFQLTRHTIFGHGTTLGHLAVNGFFVISGFLITASWDRRKSTLDYFRKRVARIYPGFIVCAVLCVFALPCLIMPTADWRHASPVQFVLDTLRLRYESYPQDASGKSIAFLGNAFPRSTNGSLWSIPYEFWCYIGVALLGTLGLMGRRAVVLVLYVMSLLVALVFSGWHIQFGGSWFGTVFGFPPFWARLLPFYLAGVVAWRYRDVLTFNSLGGAIALSGMAVTCVIPHGWSVGLPLFGAYFLLWLCLDAKFPVIKTSRWGDWSYGLYLYAFPIQQLIVWTSGGSMNPWLLLAISLPASLVAGALSWHLVEKWFLRAVHRETPVKPVTPEAIPVISR
jgi:peptidoglycan/LPS O-acetylase OafA/YrhL